MTNIATETELILQSLAEMGPGVSQVVSAKTNVGLGGIDRDDRPKIKKYLMSNLNGISEDTIESYFAANETSTVVTETFSLGERFVVIDDDEMRKIFRDDDGWDRFRSTYPDSS